MALILVGGSCVSNNNVDTKAAWISSIQRWLLHVERGPIRDVADSTYEPGRHTRHPYNPRSLSNMEMLPSSTVINMPMIFSSSDEDEDEVMQVPPELLGVRESGVLAGTEVCSMKSMEVEGPTRRVKPSVRAKAAYFEALIKSNTTAFVKVRLVPSLPRDYDAMFTGNLSFACTSQTSGCSMNTNTPPPIQCEASRVDSDDERAVNAESSARFSTLELASLRTMRRSPSADGYSEVQLTLRLPNAKRRAEAAPEVPHPEPTTDASAAEMDTLRARVVSLEASLARRETECENLMRIVRELTESRGKAVSARAALSERYADLQGEYARSVRVAELSRAVSRKHMEITARERESLREARTELRVLRASTSRLAAQADRAAEENAMLRQRLSVLERLDDAAASLAARGSLTGSPITHARWQLAETY